ncbi:hypothetical protein BC830DRAFT_1133953 [Chytriomyces sp. MP71]|nr:hypothetical protein BC830DRAFT_1133953 [Chytriomyces sp. MP71]
MLNAHTDPLATVVALVVSANAQNVLAAILAAPVVSGTPLEFRTVGSTSTETDARKRQRKDNAADVTNTEVWAAVVRELEMAVQFVPGGAAVGVGAPGCQRLPFAQTLDRMSRTLCRTCKLSACINLWYLGLDQEA